MNIYTLLMIIPVVLAVALIIMIVRRNITENPGGRIDIAPVIPAVVVLMIAIMVIGGISYSVADLEDYDEDSGTLTIKQDIRAGTDQPWDDYASDVKNLVIQNGVSSIGDGALSNLTSLEYISIPSSLSDISGAMDASFYDCNGDELEGVSGKEFVGIGDGSFYWVDPDAFVYNDYQGGQRITGFASAYADAICVAIPAKHNGLPINVLGSSSFQANTAITMALDVPDSNLRTVGSRAFQGCTALTDVRLNGPTGVTTNVFQESGAVNVEMRSLTSVGNSGFSKCISLTSLTTPSLESLDNNAFWGCTALEVFDLPSITTVASGAFINCTGVTSVTFGPGLTTVAEGSFPAWTFYASDGSTEIDKTVASNLAGKTFQGTAAALVEVSAGTLSLTPDQLQMVHLHDSELLDLQNQSISIDPLPFQPSVQTQDQEPVSA